MPENDGDGQVYQRAERFESIPQRDVPKGRDGKHKHIIVELLESLANLKDGAALKVDLDLLPDSKENIRAALSRATKTRNMNVATSSDEKYLYIWNVTE
ncbi:MAG TPA: hypothetical protein VJU82_10005 [Acidobacteriaceae bacterium]|nr:hypothetical protein [Acidobacteriaceae bacterium]